MRGVGRGGSALETIAVSYPFFVSDISVAGDSGASMTPDAQRIPRAGDEWMDEWMDSHVCLDAGSQPDRDRGSWTDLHRGKYADEPQWLELTAGHRSFRFSLRKIEK